MEELFTFFYVLSLTYYGVNGNDFSTVGLLNIEMNSTKSALRYGFQKTSECLNFQKAFLCVRKCLDLNYDIAYADQNCKCTCYFNKEKAKYTQKQNTTRTIWKLGAPTTSIPPWAQKKIKMTEATEPNNIVDVSELDIGHDSDTSKLNHSTLASGEPTGVVGTSISPLGNATISGDANGGTETVKAHNATVKDGTTVAATEKLETTQAKP